jgi:hypothetical protein
MGMGMGVNSYPPVYMGDPMGLFLCRGYKYGVVIPGGYLSIAISIYNQATNTDRRWRCRTPTSATRANGEDSSMNSTRPYVPCFRLTRLGDPIRTSELPWPLFDHQSVVGVGGNGSGLDPFSLR